MAAAQRLASGNISAGELKSIWKLFGGARVQKKGGKK